MVASHLGGLDGGRNLFGAVNLQVAQVGFLAVRR